MSDYQVEFSATAEKQFRKLQKPVQVRLARVIKDLAAEPRPRGCRRLRGYDDVYRVRAGVYRIIYTVSDQALVVEVVRVGHRREVYRS